MKKILVVLLVLAVAGGVFAQQGEWSLSGGVQIGTEVDFDSHQGMLKSDGTKYPATVDGHQYDGDQKGELNVDYTLEGLKAYVHFTAKAPSGNGMVGGVNYEGERFGLTAEADILKLLAAGQLDYDQDVGTLWGYYNLLDGLIRLEGDYNHKDSFWVSDKTAGIIGANEGPNWDNDAKQYNPYGNPVVVYDPWKSIPVQRGFKLGTADTWGDGGAYGLVANVVLSSFNFGIKVPILYHETADRELVEDVLKNSLVGLKFGLEIVEIAAQFYMRDYGVYFGGKAFAGPITVGLSFSGILNEKDLAGNAKGLKMKFGGSLDYSAELFSAYISAFYALEKINATGLVGTIIGVQPGFYFNVIPEYLRFKTDVGFYFLGEKVDGAAQPLDVPVVWSLHPQLFWNFLGTGANDYGGIATGMAIGYNMMSGRSKTSADDASTLTSKLDIGFKWSF